MALDLGTAVAYLDLDLTAFNSGIETVVSSIEGLNSVISGNFSSLGDVFIDAGRIATNLGNDLTKGLTLPIAALGSSAIDSFIEYESAFTGVKKTLDVGNRTAEETAQLYQELSAAIEDMATRTASTAPEIAEVAEIAGQLGISAEDLIGFTEVMVMLGDTTNLSSAEAAESLAKFINITGTSKSDVDRLGASIVDLGNNFATNESDIVRMSTRLASAGTIAGLTERDILALSTAMSSVGIRAEAGGSSMSQTLTQIEKAVQMSIAGDEGAIEVLNTLAQVSGMSAEEFSNAWIGDPMTALTSFLYGLGELDEQGESTVLILDQLGMTGIRQSNMLKALGLAAGVLEEAVATSNEAWDENVALTNEAELRYGTLESQLSQLNQEWEIMKRELAEMLIPILRELMDIARELMDWWRGLSDGTKENIVQFLEFAAVIGPIVTIIGKLTTGFGLFLKIFSSIGSLGSSVVSMFKVLFGATNQGVAVISMMNGEVAKSPGLLATLGQGIKSVFTMIGSAITSVVGFIGKIGAAFIQHIVPIMTTLTGVVSVIGGIVTAVMAFFDMWNNGFTVAKGVVMALGLAIAAIGAMLLGAPAAVAAVVAAVVGFVATLAIAIKENWDSIKQWTSDLWENIKGFFSDGWAAITTFFSDVWDSITRFFSNAWESVTGFFSNAWEAATTFFGNLATSLGEFILNSIKSASEFFSNMFNGIKEFVSNAVRNVVEFFSNVGQKSVSFFSDIFGKLADFNMSMLLSIAEFVLNAVNAVADFFSNLFSRFGEFIGNVFGKFGEFLSNILGRMADFVSNVVSSVADFFNNIRQMVFSFFTENGADIINFFSSVFGKLGDFFVGAFSFVGDWLGNIRNSVANWFDSLVGWIKTLGSYFFDAGANIFSGLWDGMKSMWNKLTGWITDAFNWISEKVSGIWDKASSWLGFNGSHANGLDYVPYDGYIAQLHQGERVLTKSENKEYNAGGNGSGGGDTFNFYNTQPDPYEYARQMKRAKREMALG